MTPQQYEVDPGRQRYAGTYYQYVKKNTFFMIDKCLLWEATKEFCLRFILAADTDVTKYALNIFDVLIPFQGFQ